MSRPSSSSPLLVIPSSARRGKVLDKHDAKDDIKLESFDWWLWKDEAHIFSAVFASASTWLANASASEIFDARAAGGGGYEFGLRKIDNCCKISAEKVVRIVFFKVLVVARFNCTSWTHFRAARVFACSQLRHRLPTSWAQSRSLSWNDARRQLLKKKAIRGFNCGVGVELGPMCRMLFTVCLLLATNSRQQCALRFNDNIPRIRRQLEIRGETFTALPQKIERRW